MSIGHNDNYGPREHFYGVKPDFELFGREKRVADADDGILVLGGTAIGTTNRFASLTGRHKLNPLLGDVIIDKPAGFEASRHGRHHIDKAIE